MRYGHLGHDRAAWRTAVYIAIADGQHNGIKYRVRYDPRRGWYVGLT